MRSPRLWAVCSASGSCPRAVAAGGGPRVGPLYEKGWGPTSRTGTEAATRTPRSDGSRHTVHPVAT